MSDPTPPTDGTPEGTAPEWGVPQDPTPPDVPVAAQQAAAAELVEPAGVEPVPAAAPEAPPTWPAPAEPVVAAPPPAYPAAGYPAEATPGVAAPPPAYPAPGYPAEATAGAAVPPPAYPAPGYPAPAVGPQTSSNAIIALILAIVSWAVCPIVPAVVALVLASNAQKEITASGGRIQGGGLVTAAKIVSWVNIGLWAAVLVVGVFFLVLFAVAGGMSESNF
jgi:hypothetical protein